MKTKIIIISGKKGSGKTTLAKHICDLWKNHVGAKTYKAADCRIYSFADPLKHFCINVLGLTPKQCYGSEDDKNSMTDLRWINQSQEVLKAYSKRNKKRVIIYPSGYMTAREVMEVVGTQIVRKWKPDAWCQAVYNMIETDQPALAVISDARNPNEITVGTEMGAKSIRLLYNPYNSTSDSECALDNFPLGEFSLVVDNSVLTEKEKNKFVESKIIKWFKEK